MFDHYDEYKAIMEVNKNNKFITYKIDTKFTDINEQTDTNEIQIDKRSKINNPIPELISYIKTKHNEDVEQQINEYVSEIYKKEEEE